MSKSHAQVPGDWSQKDLMSFHLSLGMEEFQSATWSELRTPLKVTDHNVRLELLPDFVWVQMFASPNLPMCCSSSWHASELCMSQHLLGEGFDRLK